MGGKKIKTKSNRITTLELAILRDEGMGKSDTFIYTVPKVNKVKNLKKSTPCTYKIVNTSIHKLGDKIPFLDYSVEDLIKIPGFIL